MILQQIYLIILVRADALICSGISVTLNNVVSVAPGQIQLTRTPSELEHSFKLAVKLTTPCFAAQYTGINDIGKRPTRTNNYFMLRYACSRKRRPAEEETSHRNVMQGCASCSNLCIYTNIL